MQRKVNRFTFDAHSVVLFSALVLSSAVSAATPSALTNAPLTPATTSSVSVPMAQPAAVQKMLIRSAVSAQNGSSDRKRN